MGPIAQHHSCCQNRSDIVRSKRKTLRYLIPIFLLFSLSASPSFSQGEHARRAAAELRVILGDARTLTASPAPSRSHLKGLYDRLRGTLSALAILMRLADQERGRSPRNVQSVLAGLAAALDRNNFAGFIDTLSDLTSQYPLPAKVILPATPTPARLNRAKEIHQSLCSVCHDEPDREVERPAYNLFKQANAVSVTEFAARMMIGVRGDRVTGLGNPLNDEELASLIAYYRSVQQ